MYKSNLCISIFVALVATSCGTTNTASSTDSNKGKDSAQAISTEFRKEGVTIFYKTNGDVYRIVSSGYASVWQQQYEQVAELEAKEKLVKFLRGETVTSTRKNRIIAKSLERAQDANFTKTKTSDGTIATIAEDLENDSANNSKQEENSSSVSQGRKAAINNAQTVTSTLTVTASGRLNAVRKISGELIENGKTYVGAYAWSPVDQQASKSINKMMDLR